MDDEPTTLIQAVGGIGRALFHELHEVSKVIYNVSEALHEIAIAIRYHANTKPRQ